MANENVGKFEELLRSSEEIQAKLRAAVDAYDGDGADAQAFFDATIGKLASEAGLPFSYDEGRAFAMEGVDLDDSELDAVAGGGICYGPGGNGGPGNGDCLGNDDWESGMGACAYVGGGMFTW